MAWSAQDRPDRRVVLQPRSSRSCSPSYSDYSDYSDDSDSTAGIPNAGSSIWDADEREEQAPPPGQWQMRGDPFGTHLPVHHMPVYPHALWPPMRASLVPHDILGHAAGSLPKLGGRPKRRALQEPKASQEGVADTLRKRAWKRLPDGPLEEEQRKRRQRHIVLEMPQLPNLKPRTVKVSNVPPSVSVKHLHELFESAVGKVTSSKEESAHVLLTFERSLHAAKAVELFCKGTIDGHIIEVELHD
ncbi:unnamed protein product [Effrenium voratum]|nr:unnamed protein product [Effrenium voratum]